MQCASRNVNSYEKADRTDFGDINGNGTIEELRIELTTGNGWKPIAKRGSKTFSGIFSGNRHEIKNIYINNTTTENVVGLFATSGNSTIKDLGVTGQITSNVAVDAGGIVGVVYRRLYL